MTELFFILIAGLLAISIFLIFSIKKRMDSVSSDTDYDSINQNIITFDGYLDKSLKSPESTGNGMFDVLFIIL